MSVKLVRSSASAYQYPLLIKQLLLTPLATAPDREITYQGKLRYNYRTLNERIGRLANGLAGLGVEYGQGFLYSRPIAAHEAEMFILTSRSARGTAGELLPLTS